MHPGKPTSVPFPLLVYAVGIPVGSEYQPLPDSVVALDRNVAEADLEKSDNENARLIEQRILPWAPAEDKEHRRRSSRFEYTVGYSDGDQHTPWGLSISTDRSAIEAELSTVQTVIATESHVEHPPAVLVLERPIFPWYPARPKSPFSDSEQN